MFGITSRIFHNSAHYCTLEICLKINTFQTETAIDIDYTIFIYKHLFKLSV